MPALCDCLGSSPFEARDGAGHGAEFVVRFPARTVDSAEAVRERSSGSHRAADGSAPDVERGAAH